jgi:hypothetical protein
MLALREKGHFQFNNTPSLEGSGDVDRQMAKFGGDYV